MIALSINAKEMERVGNFFEYKYLHNHSPNTKVFVQSHSNIVGINELVILVSQ